jgi:hypothetical protein
MVLSRTTSWHYGISFEPGIDFAIWVLEQDGLQVPPFDRHGLSTPDAGVLEPLTDRPQEPPGAWHFPPPGYLQPFGLDPVHWRTWLDRLVLDVVELQIQLRANPRPHPRLSLTDPAALYPGPEALQAALRQAHQDYRDHVAVQRRRIEGAIAPFQAVKPAAARRHWRTLSQARGQLPPVQYFLTGYPHPIVQAVPPSSVILAFGPDRTSAAAYWDALLHGLHTLQD